MNQIKILLTSLNTELVIENKKIETVDEIIYLGQLFALYNRKEK